MTRKTDGKTPPGLGAGREDRLKAALKANMARRKAQMRARGTKPAVQGPDGADRADGADETDGADTDNGEGQG